MKTPKAPRGGTTHQNLRGTELIPLKDFVDGKEPFMWIFGRPRLGKSQGIKALIKDKKILFHSSGKVTPSKIHPYTNDEIQALWGGAG